MRLVLRLAVACATSLLSIPLPGQQAASEGVRGESLRLLVTGRPGLHDALAARELVGDHVRLGHLSGGGGWETAEMVLERGEFARLRAGLAPGTLVAVLEESRPFREIEAMRAVLDPDPGYHTRAEVVAELQQFELSYPNLAKLYDLQSRYGAPRSHDGHELWALRISNAPDQDQDEPNVVVSANTHAGELATIEVPLYVADKLLSEYGNDPQLTQLVDENQIWIVPNLNPDGLEYTWSSNNLWRKNRRDNGGGVFGVDMNRNYPFFWGQCGSSTSPGSSTYRGPGAASEPEVQAFLLMAEAEGFERLLDFHCTGPDVRHPYNPLVVNAIPAAVRASMDPLQNTIASAMGYATRGTCCCGTLMEWNFAAKGTMSFLVEFGTCSGPYGGTVAELDRAWPGIREYLFAPVPLKGHVTSSLGGPLVADITVGGQAYQDGQAIRSGGRFGRYHLWFGPGTYDVTFTAEDHLPVTVPITLTAGQTVEQDVVLPWRPAASHEAFGVGCAGTGTSSTSCPSRNPAGGTLAAGSSTNEYAYAATTSDAITVTGFRLFTQAVGAAANVPAHLYLEDAGGGPAPQPVATGMLAVGTQPGFYTVQLSPPTAVAAGATFYVAADTTDVFPSNLSVGDPGIAYWRRPPRSASSWAVSTRVQSPSFSVSCSGSGGANATPALSTRGVPAVGGTFDVDLAQAAPNAPAALLVGASRTAWGGGLLPFALAPLGAPSCSLLVAPHAQFAARTDGDGRATRAIAIPNQAALVGAAFYDQYLVLDVGANALGVALTNGGVGVIGY